jgi:hypothetical protein
MIPTQSISLVRRQQVKCITPATIRGNVNTIARRAIANPDPTYVKTITATAPVTAIAPPMFSQRQAKRTPATATLQANNSGISVGSLQESPGKILIPDPIMNCKRMPPPNNPALRALQRIPLVKPSLLF